MKRTVLFLSSALIFPTVALAGPFDSVPPPLPPNVANGVPQLDASALIRAAQIPPVTALQPSYAPSPVGAFNAYSSGLYALYSPVPALSSYTGPLYIARRESDDAVLVVSVAGNTFNSAALSTWAAGSDVYVATLYDQTGNGHTLIQPTTTSQVKLNLNGAYPTLEFDGFNGYFPATAPLASWLNNTLGASVVAFRQAELTNPAATHTLIYASISTGPGSRLTMGVDSVTGTDVVEGRRLDTDSLNRSGGFVPDNQWDIEIGRYDYANAKVYHSTSLNNESRTFQTAGNTSATVPQTIIIGSLAGSSYYSGKVAAIALYGAALSDATSSAMTNSLAMLIPAFAAPASALDWGALGQTGTYTLAPALVNYTVDAPNGNTPSLADLQSLRYHHHTKVAVVGGRTWVAYSGAASSEEQGGQITEVNSSTTSWVTSTGPQVVVPPQSLPFQLTGAGDINGTRISYPRAFVQSGGNLYLVAAVDQVNTGVVGAVSFQQGMALIAVQCNSDGTISAPFLVSTAPYSPLAGVSAIAYDSTLGPALFASASLNGTWGGSAPGQLASSFLGWRLQGGGQFVEPTTIALTADGLSLFRIWRKVSGSNNQWLYTSLSLDGGRTWTSITRTNVPSAGAETTGLQLSDGRIVVVGNPQNISGGTQRDPLYIATFSGTTGKTIGVLAVRQGLPNTPTYPNGAVGGAQYPGITSDGTLLYISYSITKQNIGLTTIPIVSLP